MLGDWSEWSNENSITNFKTSQNVPSHHSVPIETAKLTAGLSRQQQNFQSNATATSGGNNNASSHRPAAKSSGALLNSYFKELEPSIKATKKVELL